MVVVVYHRVDGGWLDPARSILIKLGGDMSEWGFNYQLEIKNYSREEERREGRKTHVFFRCVSSAV
jgi:hypothetical protein